MFLLRISFLMVDNTCLRLRAIIENASIKDNWKNSVWRGSWEQVMCVSWFPCYIWALTGLNVCECRKLLTQDMELKSKENVGDSTTSKNSQDQTIPKYNFLVELSGYFQKNIMALTPQFELLYSR